MMKIFTIAAAAALCLVSGAAAFSAQVPESGAAKPVPPEGAQSSELAPAEPPASGQMDMFPPGTFPPLEVIQGGGTVKTFQMPPWAERVQYTLRTNGRPLKATVQIWIGPLRNVHTLEIDSQDGSISPFSATMKFKKVAPVLKISTSPDLTLPVMASVSVPSPERAEVLAKNTDKVWTSASLDEKLTVQGGSVEGGGGAIRTWNIPNEVSSVQVICWAKDTSKKSMRMMIEVLNGPNNDKQVYNLQCGGGSQPYHAVFQTKGPGWVIRVRNKKFVEDGLFQVAVVPLEGEGQITAGKEAIAHDPMQSYASPAASFTTGTVGNSYQKKWWE